MLQQHREEDVKQGRAGASTQPCLTPLLMGNGSEDDPSKTTVPFMSSWKDTTMLRKCGGQPIFSKRRNSPFETISINIILAL
ncbi:hypothetical protein DPMN_108334 [Dreissena polymorpha]|uniref:Uncharacterized protein n=1 Tax=Dreissena polymorpha TaxID=45954 RepID=A0A9D4K8X7_DREPO|nr:hypothetical protein DPMN_108334 [Dreissena polymorpha]